MTARAHAKFNPMHMGVSLAIAQEGGTVQHVRMWETSPPYVTVDDGSAEVTPPVGYSDWLQMSEDEARAIYEALADYFGHSGHDTRSLRKDYDAERARVDKLIDNLLESR